LSLSASAFGHDRDLSGHTPFRWPFLWVSFKYFLLKTDNSRLWRVFSGRNQISIISNFCVIITLCYFNCYKFSVVKMSGYTCICWFYLGFCCSYRLMNYMRGGGGSRSLSRYFMLSYSSSAWAVGYSLLTARLFQKKSWLDLFRFVKWCISFINWLIPHVNWFILLINHRLNLEKPNIERLNLSRFRLSRFSVRGWVFQGSVFQDSVSDSYS
jgi:hypothetical protein